MGRAGYDPCEEGDFVERMSPSVTLGVVVDGGETVGFEKDEAARLEVGMGVVCGGGSVFVDAVLAGEGAVWGIPSEGGEVGLWEEVDVGVDDWDRHVELFRNCLVIEEGMSGW